VLLDLEQIDKYRIWEQYTLTGRKNTVNYGRLLSYLSDARRFQADIGCGRVYTSTYLGVEPRGSTPEKEYILVIELLPARGATYENQPISLAKFMVGWKQVVLHLRDLQTRKFRRMYVFNCEEPVETTKLLLDQFYGEGLMPIASSDYFFGQYRPELQYVFDNIVDRLDEDDVKEIKSLLKDKDFKFYDDYCRKDFGNFVMRIYRKNRYGSYILAFQDLEEKVAIHWALKGQDMVDAVDSIMMIYEKWKTRVKGVI